LGRARAQPLSYRETGPPSRIMAARDHDSKPVGPGPALLPAILRVGPGARPWRTVRADGGRRVRDGPPAVTGRCGGRVVTANGG
jgi:hypothetical protein